MKFPSFAALRGEPLKRRRARFGAQPAAARPARNRREQKNPPGPRAVSRRRGALNRSEDGLGSVVATNDPTGTVSHSVVFDAWGNTKSEVGTRIHPFTYTGREVGEAGLLYYRARFYQPGIGKFGQEDPIGRGKAPSGYQPNLAGDPHLYGYALGSPLSLKDPTGLKCSETCPECPGGFWWGYGVQTSFIGLPAFRIPGMTWGGSAALQTFHCASAEFSCTYLVLCGQAGGGEAGSITAGPNFAFGATCSDDIAGGALGGNLDVGKPRFTTAKGTAGRGIGASADIAISPSSESVTTSLTFGFVWGAGGGGGTGCKTKKLSCWRQWH